MRDKESCHIFFRSPQSCEIGGFFSRSTKPTNSSAEWCQVLPDLTSQPASLHVFSCSGMRCRNYLPHSISYPLFFFGPWPFSLTLELGLRERRQRFIKYEDEGEPREKRVI